MPSTYTTTIQLEKQQFNENNDTWGDRLDTAFDKLDAAINGWRTISLSGLTSPRTLTFSQGSVDEASYAGIKFTGSLTATFQITIPSVSRHIIIENATSGGQSLSIKTASGTAALVPSGKRIMLISDGSSTFDAINATSDDFTVGGDLAVAGTLSLGSALTLTAPLPIASGGTGAASASAARTALGSTSTGDALFTAATAIAARGSLGVQVTPRVIVGADSVVAGDYSKLLSCSGTFTLSLGAVSGFTAGFYCIVLSNTGRVTIDPSGAETVDGAATVTLGPGEARFLIASTTGWFTIGKNKSRGCLVSLTGNKTIPDSTVTPVGWDSEVYDTDAIHDNVTNPSRLTVPAGVTKVRISASAMWVLNATGLRNLAVYKNGASFIGWFNRFIQTSSTDNYGRLDATTAIVPCVAGDYFEIVVWHNAGGNLDLNNAAETWACMEIIE